MVDILDKDNLKETAFIYDDTDNKITVGVEQQSTNLLTTAFHHVVTEDDLFWHQYLVRNVHRSLGLDYDVNEMRLIGICKELEVEPVLFGSWSVNIVVSP